MGSLHHGEGVAEVDVDAVAAASRGNVECDRAGGGSGGGDGGRAASDSSDAVGELDLRNGCCNGSLLGALVEVRNRSIGYRGSWHPAKVLKLDSGRGLVEYENLLAGDRTPNFQEYVPFSEALLRPRPPPLSGKSHEAWRRGLWVDAFYGDAWWEGVLMDDAQLPDEDLQVFFPDEGDRRGFGRRNLRVSQEWDCKTGTWQRKGQWTDFASIEGRKIRVKRTFAVKPKQSGDTSSGILVANGTEKRKRESGSGSGSDTDDDETIYHWCKRHRKKIPSRIPLRIESSEDPGSRIDGGDAMNEQSKDPEAAAIDLVAGNRTGADHHRVDNIQAMIMRSGLSPLVDQLEMLHLKLMRSKTDETAVSEQGANGKTSCEPVSIAVPRRRPNRKLIESTGLTSVKVAAPAKNNDELLRSAKLSRHWVNQDYGERDPLLIFRNKAQKVLFESGWTVCYRLRERFSRSGKEAFFVSPEGKPYMGLATACREFLRRNKHSKAIKDRVKVHLQLVARSDYGFYSYPGVETSQLVSRPRSRSESEESSKLKRINKKGNAETRNGRSRTGCRLEALFATPARPRQEDESEMSVIKRMTLFSWLTDMGILSENENIQLVNSDTEAVYAGVATVDGILCSCCKKSFSVSGFRDHTGSSRGSSQMRLGDGRSILDCELAALKAMELRDPEPAAEEVEIDENDDTCAVCGHGGQLVCCDHCPSTFHLKCLRLENVPEGDWFCPRCCCASCGNSLYDPSAETGILYCDQCEREYHSRCVPGGAMKYESGENQFCSRKCLKIFRGLRKLVGRMNKLDNTYSWTLLRSEIHDPSAEGSNLENFAEINTRLALALTVIQECFRPMIDPRSKIDMVSHILYNRRGEDKRMDFRGFYTVMLEKDQEVVSVASIRVHGAHAAEIPFIGTRSQYRKQGMCRRLINVIQQVLQALEVQTLMLPAIPEFIDTWTSAFGFQKLTAAQGIQLMELNIVTFPGSSVLQKPLTWLECGRKLSPIAEELAYQSLLETPDQTDDEAAIAKPLPRPAISKAPGQKSAAADPMPKPAKKPATKPIPKPLQAPAMASDRNDEGEVYAIRSEMPKPAKSRSNRPVKASSWITQGMNSIRRNPKPDKRQSAEGSRPEQPGRIDPEEEADWIEEQHSARTSQSAEPRSPTRTFARRSRSQHQADDRDNNVHNRLIDSQGGSSADTGFKNVGGLWIASWPKSKRSVLPKYYKARFKIEKKKKAAAAMVTTITTRRSVRAEKR